MSKEIELKKDEDLTIKLEDGTIISISQDSNLQMNYVNVSHHKTRVMNEITLNTFGYSSYKENENFIDSWTECKSTLENSITKNKTVVNHIAYNQTINK